MCVPRACINYMNDETYCFENNYYAFNPELCA